MLSLFVRPLPKNVLVVALEKSPIFMLLFFVLVESTNYANTIAIIKRPNYANTYSYFHQRPNCANIIAIIAYQTRSTNLTRTRARTHARTQPRTQAVRGIPEAYLVGGTVCPPGEALCWGRPRHALLLRARPPA